MDFDVTFCLQHSNIKWINIVRERNGSIWSFIKYDLQVKTEWRERVCTCVSACLPVWAIWPPYLYTKSHVKSARGTESYLSGNGTRCFQLTAVQSPVFRPQSFPSSQSAIHFQSRDPVIANSLLYTETCMYGFISTVRDMCQSGCCKELEFARTKNLLGWNSMCACKEFCCCKDAVWNFL